MRTAAETPTKPAGHTFFRQSGWLMFANIAGGVMMWAVHFLAKKIPEGEYGKFGVFLAVLMVLPTIPLQMLLAQQTARSLASGQTGILSGVIRMTAAATFLVWLAASVVVLAFQQSIVGHWKLGSPLGIYLTLPIVLLSLWMPMFCGVLQGKQDFLWLGWTMILNSAVRIGVASFIVLALAGYAAGMLVGVLAGIAMACLISAWQSRSLWLVKPEPFDWRALMRQVVPLFIGFVGFQVLFTGDAMFVKAYFSEEQSGFYTSAGTLSRALMWLVMPLAAVMFPRIVHSAAKSEETNMMSLVLLGTAALAVVGATCLWALGPYVVQIVYKESYVQTVSLILPWYAFAMVPLSVANVLINNLLARPEGQLPAASCVLILALIYMYALTRFHESLVMVLQVMGVSNTILFLVCAWFTWRPKRVRPL